MRRFVAHSIGAFVAVAVGLVIASPRAGAEYPDRVVRIELGFPAGGGADILARWYADKLQQLSGGHFIVENKVGASGNLALQATATAKPDGSTLLFASTVTTAGNTTVFKDMPLDVRKDLVPVVGFAETPFVLCVAPDSPINSIADLTAFIKSKNGKATYGSATTSALASTALYLQKARQPQPMWATRQPPTQSKTLTAIRSTLRLPTSCLRWDKPNRGASRSWQSHRTSGLRLYRTCQP